MTFPCHNMSDKLLNELAALTFMIFRCYLHLFIFKLKKFCHIDDPLNESSKTVYDTFNNIVAFDIIIEIYLFLIIKIQILNIICMS